jgi:hypothetical protein
MQNATMQVSCVTVFERPTQMDVECVAFDMQFAVVHEDRGLEEVGLPPW